MASNRLTAEHLYAEDMRRQMQSYLDAVLGTKKAIVSVQATLDFDQTHTQSTEFVNDPKKPMLISAQQSDESYTSDKAAAPQNGAPAGTASNTPGQISYPAAQKTSTKTGSYDHSTNIYNYENNKTLTDTEKAPGQVQHLAVAVLIDDKVQQSDIDGITKYLNTLAGNTGANDTAHVVTISKIAFSTDDLKAQQDMMKKAEASTRMEQFEKIGAIAIVAIVLLIIFLRSSKAALRTVVGTQLKPEELVGGYIPAGHLMDSPAPGSYPDFNSPPQFNTNGSPSLPGSSGTQFDQVSEQPVSIEDMLDDIPTPRRKKKKRVSIDGIEEHVDIKLESVREMVQDSPETVALLMKGWITNDIDGHH